LRSTEQQAADHAGACRSDRASGRCELGVVEGVVDHLPLRAALRRDVRLGIKLADDVTRRAVNPPIRNPVLGEDLPGIEGIIDGPIQLREVPLAHSQRGDRREVCLRFALPPSLVFAEIEGAVVNDRAAYRASELVLPERWPGPAVFVVERAIIRAALCPLGRNFDEFVNCLATRWTQESAGVRLIERRNRNNQETSETSPHFRFQTINGF